MGRKGRKHKKRMPGFLVFSVVSFLPLFILAHFCLNDYSYVHIFDQKFSFYDFQTLCTTIMR